MATRTNRIHSTGKRTKRLLLIFGIVLAAIFLLVASTLGWFSYQLISGIQEDRDGSVNAAPPKNIVDFRDQKRVSIVIMGHDVPELANGQYAGKRSDTLMVATFDPIRQSVDIVSIPRDLRVVIPNRKGYDKINAAYAYGGKELVVETVNELFGGLEIEGYVDIGVQAFVEAVDLLGGVDVVVPYDMYYVDPLQNLYINIKKGPQHLDGYNAMGFVRERYGDPRGDLGRIERQHQFIKAMADKLLRVETILKIPQLIEVATEYVETNLTTQDMLALAAKMRKPDTSKLTTVTLPTYDLWISGISYQGVKEVDLIAYKERYILGIDRDANAQLTVQVLNGTDLNGWAGRVASELEALSYDVRAVGNADEQRNTTLVAYAPGKQEEARVLARTLQELEPDIEIELKETVVTVSEEELAEGTEDGVGAGVDVTIILGIES